MKPFECLDEHGQIHLHHDNWHRWRDERLSVHPGEGKWRFDLDLRNPRDTLEEVPVSNPRVNTHGDGFDNHTCFYECDDWSTIYDAYYCTGEQMIRMIVESQNPEPIWGERITLLSTSTYFKCEPWGHNVPNQFAFFRDQYWQVISSELLHHEFPAGVGYPLRDDRGMFSPRRGGERIFLDVGYIYAPYVPLFNTPVVLNPADFRNRNALLARYGENRLITELWDRIDFASWHNYPKPEFKLDWRKYGF